MLYLEYLDIKKIFHRKCLFLKYIKKGKKFHIYIMYFKSYFKF